MSIVDHYTPEEFNIALSKAAQYVKFSRENGKKYPHFAREMFAHALELVSTTSKPMENITAGGPIAEKQFIAKALTEIVDRALKLYDRSSRTPVQSEHIHTCYSYAQELRSELATEEGTVFLPKDVMEPPLPQASKETIKREQASIEAQLTPKEHFMRKHGTTFKHVVKTLELIKNMSVVVAGLSFVFAFPASIIQPLGFAFLGISILGLAVLAVSAPLYYIMNMIYKERKSEIFLLKKDIKTTTELLQAETKEYRDLLVSLIYDKALQMRIQRVLEPPK